MAVTGFTNIGGGIGMPILASILTAWLTWVNRTWRPIILVGGAAAVSITATTLGKNLDWPGPPGLHQRRPAVRDLAVLPQRPHPELHGGDRVLVYLACLQFKRTWARVAVITAGLVFIVAMGLSRVFLGHHWMTDVIAAWLLGLAWVGIVILAHRLFHVIRHREHAGPAPTFDHPAHLSDGRVDRPAAPPGAPTDRAGRRTTKDDVGARGPTGRPPAAG